MEQRPDWSWRLGVLNRFLLLITSLLIGEDLSKSKYKTQTSQRYNWMSGTHGVSCRKLLLYMRRIDFGTMPFIYIYIYTHNTDWIFQILSGNDQPWHPDRTHGRAASSRRGFERQWNPELWLQWSVAGGNTTRLPPIGVTWCINNIYLYIYNHIYDYLCIYDHLECVQYMCSTGWITLHTAGSITGDI